MTLKIDELKIALHIPISPNVFFYSRVKWLRKSLDALGSPYNKAQIHLSISNENSTSVSSIIGEYSEFSNHYNRYSFHLTDKKLFEEFSYWETAGLRYMLVDDADITIFCDADIFFIKRFDHLLEEVLNHNGIYGVIAHYSPFIEREKSTIEYWNELSKKYIGKEMEFKFSHSLYPDDKCPAYFNNGFVIGNKHSWHTIKDYAYKNFKEMFYALPYTDDQNISQRFFLMQIALSLVLHKFEINTFALNEIYNCANQNEMLPLINHNVEDIRVIHYLRNTHYDRNSLFQDKNNILNFIQLENVDEISKIMQQKIIEIINNQGYN